MTILTALDEDLRTSFTSLECGLVDAVVEGRSSMETFVTRLAGLHKAATLAISKNALSAQTLALVRSVALASSAMVDNFMQIEPDTRDIDAQRLDDIEGVFQRLSFNDHRDATEPPMARVPTKVAKPSLQSPRSPSRSVRGGAHINSDKSPDGVGDPASVHRPILHKWLLQNIHNPYAPKSVVVDLSVRAGIPTKTVREWLSNMRRRIGWTAFVKSHFQGDKARAVDFAMRNMSLGEMKEGEPSTSDMPKAVAKLREVKSVTEVLYRTRFESSALAQQIEDISSPKGADIVATNGSCRTNKRKRRIDHEPSEDESIKSTPRSSKRSKSSTDRRASSSSATSNSSESASEISTPIQEFSYLDAWLTGILSHSTDAIDQTNGLPGSDSLKRGYSEEDAVHERSPKRQRQDEVPTPQGDLFGLYPPLESSILDEFWSEFDFNLAPPVTIGGSHLEGNVNIDCAGNENYGVTFDQTSDFSPLAPQGASISSTFPIHPIVSQFSLTEDGLSSSELSDVFHLDFPSTTQISAFQSSSLTSLNCDESYNNLVEGCSMPSIALGPFQVQPTLLTDASSVLLAEQDSKLQRWMQLNSEMKELEKDLCLV